MLHPVPEAVYLKVSTTRYGGNAKNLTRFIKISKDKLFLAVDLTRNKISETKCISSQPYDVEPSCKEEFDEAYDKVLASLSNK